MSGEDIQVWPSSFLCRYYRFKLNQDEDSALVWLLISMLFLAPPLLNSPNSGSSVYASVSSCSEASTAPDKRPPSAPAVPASPSFAPSSRRPIITLPTTSKLAPSHHNPGNLSEKIMVPRKAVSTKLADVLIIETRTVDVASVKARVNKPHMIALKRIFKPKKIYRPGSELERYERPQQYPRRRIEE